MGIATARSRSQRSVAGRRRWAIDVPLAEIDLGDQRFQYRLSARADDLVESIRRQGQLTPIVVWGEEPPYTIIDGFRRFQALRELRRSSILAVIEPDADEIDAFVLSFSENARRKTLGPYDKANAIWTARHRWRMEKSELAEHLGLSLRQVNRYLALLDLDPRVSEALNEERISMAHAVALHRSRVEDLDHWLELIDSEKPSAEDLKCRLDRVRPRRSRRTYLVREAQGFRLGPIRYRSRMRPEEKRRIWEALESALKIIATSEPPARK